jgi:hypothetical protein
LLELPGRLPEARQLAEEAISIEKKLDPNATEIWITYFNLAKIAETEAAQCSNTEQKTSYLAEAADYHGQSRIAKWAFAGTRHDLKKWVPLIEVVMKACSGQEEAIEFVAQQQRAIREVGEEWSRCADALDLIIAGERNEDKLCENLFFDPAVLIMAILRAIENPNWLKEWLGEISS